MGQEQPKNKDVKHEEAGYHHQGAPNRTGAKFGNEHNVNPAYGEGGKGGGAKNPGKPV